MIQEFDGPGGKLKIPGVVPKMSETPGGTDWLGPKLGEHNEEILCGLLGISPERIEDLKKKGLV
jgi:formyl-CoA transferase